MTRFTRYDALAIGGALILRSRFFIGGDYRYAHGADHHRSPGKRTENGLPASLYATDLGKAPHLARKINAGTVSVNCDSEGDMSTPFAGFKQSGFGGRDNGLETHEQYTEVKTVCMNLATPVRT
jgi:gamma-glutamyl-gamma-aminobutyraldehyde dehydrogenase